MAPLLCVGDAVIIFPALPLASVDDASQGARVMPRAISSGKVGGCVGVVS
jgi:hypothetical protein